MTEKGWLTGVVAERLLMQVKGASERRLRLYGVACCRRGWSLLGLAARKAVEVAERFADGLCSFDELIAARNSAGATHPAVRAVTQEPKKSSCWGGMRDTARAMVEAICHGPTWHAAPIDQRLGVCETLREQERAAQAGLLRCLFGNPFRPVVIEVSWKTPELVGMAEAAYRERSELDGMLDPARLAVLSDALEDASCTDAEILGHLRAPGPHGRGCWVIDLVLGLA
jgi:hypothetical protein